jgi:hypothetical protein
MTDVVHERRGECNTRVVIAKLHRATATVDMTLDYLHQLSRRVEDADAMGKPCMSGAGKYQIREPELFYTPQPLERERLNNSP